MKRLFPFFPVLFIFMFYSCEKEKYSIENDVIRTLKTNSVTHTFVNDNNKRYVENTLVSQQDKHVYKLAMTKGVQYRISVSQPGASVVQTEMTLVNIKHDTLSGSLNESAYKSIIVITSPETTNYYLIINLQKRTNPQFNYRLYFEEIVDDAISFSGLYWSANGQWNLTNLSWIELTNTGSNIYRHLKLTNSITGNPGVSFVIQNSSVTSINFGVMLSATGDYLQFSEWAYELPNTGYAFLAFENDLNYSIMRLTGGSISFDWNTLGAINLDLTAGIKVGLKYESGQYFIYLNDIRVKNINGTLQNLHILIQDCGDATTVIKNFQITY